MGIVEPSRRQQLLLLAVRFLLGSRGWQAFWRDVLCFADFKAGMSGSDQKTAGALAVEDIVDHFTVI